MADVKKKRLSQIVGTEKTINAEVTRDVSEAYKLVQKPGLFSGFSKVFEATEEEEVDFPPESQKVQHVAEDVLDQAMNAWASGMDATASKDWGNLLARGTVTVRGEVLLEDAPVTFLLFLEKKLVGIRTFVTALPELDPAQDWKYDGGLGLHKTEPVRKVKTKKRQKAIVKYPHQFSDDGKTAIPAQTEMVTEDATQGFWVEVQHSGGVKTPEKKAILRRLEDLIVAVKEAREEANSLRVDEQQVGAKLLGWLLK